MTNDYQYRRTDRQTDTVQYYTKWLLKRFDKGYVLVGHLKETDTLQQGAQKSYLRANAVHGRL